MATTTVDSVFERVKQQAEAIASDAEHTIPVMYIGDEVRQGDIYITRIPGVPHGAELVESPTRQLAPGTTQGSRHCLRSLDGVKVYRMRNAGPLDGPIIDAPGGCTIDHPEHGNRTLPGGTYAVTYQRAFAEELRRVQD